MNNNDAIKIINRQAKQDARKRLDPRFKKTMGFLVAKGFLHTNLKIQKLPNQRLKIEDAIWAGKNIEPRILEVLPAAVLRLENHFHFDMNKHKELAIVVKQLKQGCKNGNDFFGIPFSKIKIWLNLPLKDRRTKKFNEKKIMKTFRLSPQVIDVLVKISQESGQSLSKVIEEKILMQS